MATKLEGIEGVKAAKGRHLGYSDWVEVTQDRIIRTFPEVESVYGKAGRAQTATDPDNRLLSHISPRRLTAA